MDLNNGSEVMVGSLLETVADEMLEGLQIISPEWRYLYVNKTVTKQGRKSKNELLGKTMMECYPGIEKSPLFEKLQKSMNEKLDIEMENEFTYQDGKKGWFQLHIHPVSEGILILSIDITERKIAENNLQNQIQQINNLTDEMEHSQVELKQLKQEVLDLKELASQMISARVYHSDAV